MKKILFITTAYILKNSSAAIRNNSLVRGLIDLGYDVDVCTVEWPVDLSSPFFERETNGNIHLDQLPNLKRIARIKQGQLQKKEKSEWAIKFRQALKKILFFPDECYEWKKIFEWNNLEQYVCVISSSDHKVSHFVALKMKRRQPSLFWIQIWGDPWSTDVNTIPLFKSLATYYEKKLLSSTDRIVYVSGATMNEMQTKYPNLANKMYNIPRGFYFELKSQFHKSSNIRIVYTGVISYGRNPFILLDTMKKLNVASHQFTVDFYGNIPSAMRERLASYPYVTLHKSVDFEHMPEILTSASILLYLSNKKGSSQIPGKLFDYMGTDKPILCLVSDTSEPTSLFLKQFNRCMVIENSESFIIENWSKIEKISQCRFEPEKNYSPKSIASQVVSLLK